jgi:hypothetical protein
MNPKIIFDFIGEKNPKYELENFVKWYHWYDPKIIKFIDDPSEEFQLDVIKKGAHLIKYIKNQLDKKQISEKVNNYWGYQDGFNNLTPRWILREWCSFWLTDAWNDSYSVKNYSSISNSIPINSTQLVENFDTVFYKLIRDLKLTLTVDLDIINQTHSKFFIKQRFYNSQLKCQQWVNKVFDTTESAEITFDTIFDESYIQYLLRSRGFEIECNELNQFPSQTNELKKIIYRS